MDLDNTDNPGRLFFALSRDLKSIALSNIHFFKNGKQSHHAKFHLTFRLLYEYLDVGIEPSYRELSRLVSEFDYSPEIKGNGYRSVLRVVEKCCLHLLQLSRYISTVRDSMLFRKKVYAKELESYVCALGQLRGVLYYALKLTQYCQSGHLFADEEHLNSDIAESLMLEVESLSQECFYGRCLGFQYCESMQRPMQAIAIVMASYSEGYLESSQVMKVATSVFNSGKYILDPELRAKQQLPSFVCPVMEVNEMVTLGPDSFELPLVDGSDTVVITPPCAHTGPGHVYTRLISAHLRDGQHALIKSIKAKTPTPAKPQASGLIVHIHGGGFVAQSSKSHEVYLRDWAVTVGCPILSVDYSLAPQFPFPRALEECFYAYAWAVNNCHQLGSTGEKIVVVGDSAGGNLAISTAMRAASFGIRPPDGLVLVYPVTVVKYTPSPARLLSLMDPVLPVGLMARCLAAYAGIDDKEVSTPRSSGPHSNQSLSQIQMGSFESADNDWIIIAQDEEEMDKIRSTAIDLESSSPDAKKSIIDTLEDSMDEIDVDEADFEDLGVINSDNSIPNTKVTSDDAKGKEDSDIFLQLATDGSCVLPSSTPVDEGPSGSSAMLKDNSAKAKDRASTHPGLSGIGSSNSAGQKATRPSSLVNGGKLGRRKSTESVETDPSKRLAASPLSSPVSDASGSVSNILSYSAKEKVTSMFQNRAKKVMAGAQSVLTSLSSLIPTPGRSVVTSFGGFGVSEEPQSSAVSAVTSPSAVSQLTPSPTQPAFPVGYVPAIPRAQSDITIATKTHGDVTILTDPAHQIISRQPNSSDSVDLVSQSSDNGSNILVHPSNPATQLDSTPSDARKGNHIISSHKTSPSTQDLSKNNSDLPQNISSRPTDFKESNISKTAAVTQHGESNCSLVPLTPSTPSSSDTFETAFSSPVTPYIASHAFLPTSSSSVAPDLLNAHCPNSNISTKIAEHQPTQSCDVNDGHIVAKPTGSKDLKSEQSSNQTVGLKDECSDCDHKEDNESPDVVDSKLDHAIHTTGELLYSPHNIQNCPSPPRCEKSSHADQSGLTANITSTALCLGDLTMLSPIAEISSSNSPPFPQAGPSPQLAVMCEADAHLCSSPASPASLPSESKELLADALQSVDAENEGHGINSYPQAPDHCLSSLGVLGSGLSNPSLPTNTSSSEDLYPDDEAPSMPLVPVSKKKTLCRTSACYITTHDDADLDPEFASSPSVSVPDLLGGSIEEGSNGRAVMKGKGPTEERSVTNSDTIMTTNIPEKQNSVNSCRNEASAKQESSTQVKLLGKGSELNMSSNSSKPGSNQEGRVTSAQDQDMFISCVSHPPVQGEHLQQTQQQQQIDNISKDYGTEQLSDNPEPQKAHLGSPRQKTVTPPSSLSLARTNSPHIPQSSISHKHDIELVDLATVRQVLESPSTSDKPAVLPVDEGSNVHLSEKPYVTLTPGENGKKIWPVGVGFQHIEKSDSMPALTSGLMAPSPTTPYPAQSLVTSPVPGTSQDVNSDILEGLKTGMSPSDFEQQNFSSHSPLHLLRQAAVMKNPYMSPLIASDELLLGLKQVSIVGCHLDPLLDDSVMFARRLRELDVPVNLHLVDDLPHGFLNFALLSLEARQAADLCGREICNMLSDSAL